MTPEEIRAIALEVADPLRLQQYGTGGIVEFATRFLAAINAKAEPVATYDESGEVAWKRYPPNFTEGGLLYTHPAIEPEGEVVITTDESGQCVCVTRQDEEGRILSVIWEAEPAPQERCKTTDTNAAKGCDAVAAPAGAAPLPDDVQESARILRELYGLNWAANLIDRLARQVPEGCVVVPRIIPMKATDTLFAMGYNDSLQWWDDALKVIAAGEVK